MYRLVATQNSQAVAAAANTLMKSATASPKKSLVSMTKRMTSTTPPQATSTTTSKDQQQQKNYATQAAAEPFLNGSSGAYVEEMYNAWLQNPQSVHASWDAFFRQTYGGAQPGLVPVGAGPVSGGSVSEKVIDDHLAVQAIIRSYQARGHHIAKLDPLGITYADLHSKKEKDAKEIVVRNYMQGYG